MTNSGPSQTAKSFGTKRIPLTIEQAESLVAWLREKYPDKHPQNVDECRDPCKLAFKAGQLQLINDLEVIAREHNRKP
jgi:hypothetical protein